MKKIRLSYQEWAKIQGYKKVHWMECACCFFRLSKVDGCFRVDAKAYLIAYMILFIPAVVLTFFDCLWDGGLKTFELPTRWVNGSYIYQGCHAYDYCEVIWNAKSSI